MSNKKLALIICGMKRNWARQFMLRNGWSKTLADEFLRRSVNNNLITGDVKSAIAILDSLKNN